MKVNTQSVNFNADQKLIDFIQQRMDKLDQYYDKIIKSDVFLKVENTSGKQNKIFEDHLTKGPLKLWEHKHHFKKLGLKKTRIIDEINFSHWINLKSLNEYTLRRLKKSFDYKYDILSYDLSMLKKNLNKEIVLITGGTGNIGSHLVPHLNSLGYKIILLKYSPQKKIPS